MPSNANSLIKKLKKALKANKINPNIEIQEVVGIQLLKNLASITPINKILSANTRGDLNGNWTASIGAPATRRNKNTGRKPLPANVNVVTNADGTKPLFISNSTRYALDIENGNKKITPRKYTKLSLNRLVKQMKSKNIKIKVEGA